MIETALAAFLFASALMLAAAAAFAAALAWQIRQERRDYEHRVAAWVALNAARYRTRTEAEQQARVILEHRRSGLR